MTSSIQKTNVVSVTLTSNDVKQAVKTFAMSKKYINNVVKASVINILYHRLSITDDEFLTKNFNKVSFKSFRPKSKHPLIKAYFTYMGAFKDALEKNYLRDMYLYFVDDTTGDIVENYKFTFKYSRTSAADKKEEMVQDLTQATTNLLQSLFELNSHTKLDDNIRVKVEFTYFEDTPADYEPPGFESVPEENALITHLGKKGNSVLFGSLFTGFHTLKCRGRGSIFDCDDMSIANEEAVVEGEEVAENYIEVFTEDLSQNIMTADETTQVQDDNSVELVKTTRRPFNLNATYVEDEQGQGGFVSDDDFDVNAECGMCKLPSGGSLSDVETIKCNKCYKTFHSCCQGYLDRSYARKPFRCLDCQDHVEDNFLIHLKEHERNSASRVRFLMAYIHKHKRIPKGLGPMFKDTVAKMIANRFLLETKDGKLVPFQDKMAQIFIYKHKAFSEDCA